MRGYDGKSGISVLDSKLKGPHPLAGGRAGCFEGID